MIVYLDFFPSRFLESESFFLIVPIPNRCLLVPCHIYYLTRQNNKTLDNMALEPDKNC